MLRKTVAGLVCSLFLISIGLGQTELSKTYRINNDTSQEITTNISTSTIIPGISRILGFTSSPTRNTTVGTYTALYDETSTTAHSISYLIGEAEKSAGNSANKTFAYPKSLSNGLTVVTGPYSCSIIEYTK